MHPLETATYRFRVFAETRFLLEGLPEFLKLPSVDLSLFEEDDVNLPVDEMDVVDYGIGVCVLNEFAYQFMLSFGSMKNFILVILFFIVGSVVQAQPQTQTQPDPPPSTDIFLFPLENGKIVSSGVRNITKRKGYDNQPHFLPDSKKLFYTSIQEGNQSDIFLYDLGNAAAKKLTTTDESEYSPTLTPDAQFFSTIRVEKDGTQRLWKFPLSGGDPVLILEQVKPVGYHAWIDSDRVALFILGEPATLQLADIRSGNSFIVASNIGRSLHKIPGKLKISFVQKLSETTGTIKEYDPNTKQTSELIQLFPETEDYAWTPGGTLFTSKDSKIYAWNPEKGKGWIEEADLSRIAGLKKISRIAVSPDGKWLALVAEDL
jgi:WD40 repeat protein